MQIVEHQPTRPIPVPVLFTDDPASSPAAMARYLRRTSGDAAFCFARAMHEDAAWANADWGAYWADVMRLV
ncbi:hypothetical protein [Acidisphaera sp. L21]|uniref:hypothetical protein n=1 Tax=Acidisphaera sp. L21 TaxID=1641851 RepID=UPI00131B8B7B|nr:hypothetical protein [Acidisphaera sp. L21]